MILTEITSKIRKLSVSDNIRLIRILMEEIDIEANFFPFEPYKVYYLATPYNVFGAGKALIDAIRANDTFVKAE
jgi:hypothetical protein